MCHEALEVQKRMLGPEHRGKLMSLGNLSDDQGQHATAAAMYCETLEVRKRVPGQEHPDILITAESLATALRKQPHLRVSV